VARRPDPTLPKSFYQPSTGDFKLPGFSRGHMVRSGERTSSRRENRKTFVFSNILPQAQNNNAGPWNAFENYYRDQVTQGGRIAQVVAGGIYESKNPLERQVAVPSATWKVVALLKPGQTVEQIDGSTRVISVIMPNNNDDVKVEQLWQRYRVSVADIEKKTGYKFFRNIAPAVAQALKARVDNEAIPPPPPLPYKVYNWSPTGHRTGVPENIAVVRSGLDGKIKWYNRDKNYGFITAADGTDYFVHATHVNGAPVKEGDHVRFDTGHTDKGDCAINVTLTP
jgi:cold shock CspA family protein